MKYKVGDKIKITKDLKKLSGYSIPHYCAGQIVELTFAKKYDSGEEIYNFKIKTPSKNWTTWQCLLEHIQSSKITNWKQEVEK